MKQATSLKMAKFAYFAKISESRNLLISRESYGNVSFFEISEEISNIAYFADTLMNVAEIPTKCDESEQLDHVTFAVHDLRGPVKGVETVEASLRDDVAVLYSRVEGATGMPQEQLRMEFQNRSLEVGKSFAECGFRGGSDDAVVVLTIVERTESSGVINLSIKFDASRFTRREGIEGPIPLTFYLIEEAQMHARHMPSELRWLMDDFVPRDGVVLAIRGESSDTVDCIRQRIQDRMGIPPDRMVLLLEDGSRLDECRTVAEQLQSASSENIALTLVPALRLA